MAHTPDGHLSALEMSALAGVTPEQLAIIARAMQNGTLPLPPPPAQVASSNAPQSTSNPRQNSDRPPVLSSSIQAGSANADREEGEVDEDEGSGGYGVTTFLRPPPTGPRSNMPVSWSHNGSTFPDTRSRPSLDMEPGLGALESSSNPVHIHGSKHGRGASERPPKTASPPRGAPRSAALKTFLEALFEAGYTFEQLAAHVSDREALLRLTSSLALSQPASSMGKVSEVNDKPPVALRPLPAKKPAITKPGASIDRSEYLAKLQAAKSKKSDAPAKSTKPVASVANVSSVPTTAPAKPTVSKSVVPPKSSPSAKAAKDELLRKRLEAIRAAQLSKQTTPNIPALPAKDVKSNGVANEAVQQTSSSNNFETPAKVVKPFETTSETAAASDQATKPTPSPRPIQSMPSSGLPGLFMNSISISPTNSQVTTTRPVSSELAASNSSIQGSPATGAAEAGIASDASKKRIASGDMPTPKRQAIQTKPFGSTRVRDEPLIIEISEDDDDDDDEMDISNSDAESATRSSSGQTSPNSKMGNNHSPVRPSLQRASTSCSGATTVSTPGQEAYLKKMQQIELLKKQLAEREQRKLARVGIKFDDHSSSSASASRVATPVSKLPAPPAPVEQPAQSTSLPRPLQSPHTLSPELSAHAAKSLGATTASIKPAAPEQGQGLQLGADDLSSPRVTTPRPGSGLAAISTGSSTPLLSGYATSAPAPVGHSPETEPVHQIQSEPSAPAQALQTRDVGSSSEGSAIPHFSNPESQQTNGKNQGSASSTPGVYSEDDFDDIYAQPSLQDVPGPRDQKPVIRASDGEESDDGIHNDDTKNDAHTSSDEFSSTSSSGAEDNSEDSDSDGYEPELDTPAEMDDNLLADVHNSGDASDEDPGIEKGSAPAPSNDPPNDAEVQRAMVPDRLSDATTEEPSSKTQQYFTPYESPLSRFKDYRFHKDFLNEVPGGFQSLTYSHQIDPVKELCPFEAGGVCNDPKCEYQHFRYMSLSDSNLLRSLTTDHAPTKTAEEEARWKAGLAELIKELKNTNFGKQDVGLIAERIAKYRRDFIADPTSTLRLS